MDVARENTIASKDCEITREQVNIHVKELEGCQNNEDKVKHFSKSADRYEKIMDMLKFKAPEKVVETVETLMKNKLDIHILDVGAGTGLVGEKLAKSGYSNVDALDASASMLKRARDKNVYRECICHMVGESPIPFKDDTYDLVLLSSAFALNCFPVTALDEFIRVVRPGGYIINATRIFAEDWFYNSYEAHMTELEEQKKWKLVSRTTITDFLDTSVQRDGMLHVHVVL